MMQTLTQKYSQERKLLKTSTRWKDFIDSVVTVLVEGETFSHTGHESRAGRNPPLIVADNTLYSYGTHWPIMSVERSPDAPPHHITVRVTTTKNSATTSKHTNRVKRVLDTLGVSIQYVDIHDHLLLTSGNSRGF